MSAKKLRTKFSLKFLLPLSPNKSPPSSRPSAGIIGIPADFSEKMLRRHPAQIESGAPPPPPPPKDMGGDRSFSYYSPATPNGPHALHGQVHGEWDDVRYALMPPPPDPSGHSPPGLTDGVVIISQVRAPPSYTKLPPVPDELGVMRPPGSPKVPPKPNTTHGRSATSRIPIAASRVPLTQRRAATISTPEEAELRRRDAKLRKEQEEEVARREEAQRQARLKHEKEQQLIEAAREEERRKVALEQELRHAAEERRKREAIEREAEALSSMVAAERKRQDRERRRQETAKSQRMRAELEQKKRAQEQERQAWRERTTRERRALAAQLETKKTKNSRGLTVLLTGWLTVQSEDCLSYKRRYFQLREDALVLFRDAEDDSKPVETVQLSRIARIREAEDGYEDLQAINHAFALELKDLHDPWTMFTNSQEDKENLLALLSSRLTTR